MSPMPCLDLTLFIYLDTPPLFFDEYACNLHETKFFEKISQVSLCGEQQKPNVDELDDFLVLLFGIPCFLIVSVFLEPLPDFHIKLSHVS